LVKKGYFKPDGIPRLIGYKKSGVAKTNRSLTSTGLESRFCKYSPGRTQKCLIAWDDKNKFSQW
jgi:hypothetical protein